MVHYLKHPTLLLITDRSGVRQNVKDLCEESYFILTADNSIQALATVASSPLDLILIDEGFEEAPVLPFCRQIRSSLKEAPTPILLITGRLKRTFFEKALEAGVTDFLSSQFDAQEFQARLVTIQKAKTLREKTTSLSTKLNKPPRASSFFENRSLLEDQVSSLFKKACEEQKILSFFLLHVISPEEACESTLPLGAQKFFLSFSSSLPTFFPKGSFFIPKTPGLFVIIAPPMSSAAAREICLSLQTAHKKASISLIFSWSQIPSMPAFDRFITAASDALEEVDLSPHHFLFLDERSYVQ